MIEKAGRIEEILALVRAKAPAEQREALERFVNAYFQQVAPEDLIERRADDLYGAALSHWNFARKREPASRNCASTTRRSKNTAGNQPTPSSRSSTTTCPSWWIR